MGKKRPKKTITRRKFLGNIGTGLAGSYLASLPLKDPNPPHDTLAKPGHRTITIKVNGVEKKVTLKNATTLAELLRLNLHLRGTKVACNRGECGACTVLLDGKPVYSCHMLAADADGHHITTIEGIAIQGKLDPVQRAFSENDGLQCGFCTPGQIMSAHGLLRQNPKPSDRDIIYAMSGNLCRCAAYPNIIKSVRAASRSLAKEL